MVILGLIIYFWNAKRKPSLQLSLLTPLISHLSLASISAEEQGTSDPQKPLYMHNLPGDGALSGVHNVGMSANMAAMEKV